MIMHTEDVLKELCRLLGIPCSSDYLPTPKLSHFEVWKPIAEQVAEELHEDTERVAWLIETLGFASMDRRCYAKSQWIAGNMFYRLNRPVLAVERFCTCDAIYKVLDDPLERARMSIGWIAALVNTDKFPEGISIGEFALGELGKSNLQADVRRKAFAFTNIGLIYQKLGEFENAIDCFRKTLNWAFTQDISLVENIIEVGSSLTCIGIAQTFLGQYAEAMASYQQGRKWLQRFAADAECQIEIARVDLHVLWLEMKRKYSHQSVEIAIRQAFASRDLLGTEKQLDLLAQIDLLAISWWINTKQFDRIDVAQLEMQLAHFSQVGLAFETWMATILLGQLDLLHHDNPHQAFQRFFSIEKAALEVNNRDIAYQAAVWKARAQRELGQFHEAQQALEKALLNIEAHAADINSAVNRVGFIDDKLIGFTDLAELYLAANQITDAFWVIERARAFTLRTTSRVLGPQLPLAHADMQHATQGYLPPNTLLISYAEIAGELRAFVVTPSESVRVHALGSIPSSEEIETLLEQFQTISKLRLHSRQVDDGLWKQQRDRCQRRLQQWHNRLLAPLHDQVIRSEKILLSVDGALASVPFACLFDGTHYLAQHCQVVRVPSFALWQIARATTKQSVSFVPHYLVVGCDIVERKRNQLLGAVLEANVVAETLGVAKQGRKDIGTLLIGDDATRLNVLSKIAQSSFIYIAAHGRHRKDIPSLSYIELKESRLRMADMLKLKLPASEVVLSACDMAQGNLTGNILLGMCWAFLQAGAKTVLACHWKIDDAVTQMFMTQLMRQFQSGVSLSAALNNTQREFIDLNDYRSHPYFWGFTLPNSMDE